MEARYNIYFAGQVLEGHEPANVRERLGKVFNADNQTLDKLFSGKPQLLKRDCDKATARKYQQAIESAGAQAIIKTIEPEAPAQAAPASAMTAAEKIAALAAAPDETAYTAANTEPADPNTPTATDTSPENGDDLTLTPEGTEVLRENERSEPVTRDVDTSGLEVDASAQRLSEEPPAAPAAPDTSHLDMGDVGDDIPNLASGLTPLSPNTDALDLSPEGTDFSDCAAPDAKAPDLDLTGIDLAPEGADVLDEKHRKREQPAAPATDHISLED